MRLVLAAVCLCPSNTGLVTMLYPVQINCARPSTCRRDNALTQMNNVIMSSNMLMEVRQQV
uniref:Uncharacterized protein MANES_18G079400 n=1 Tax=Rhizophora mucronata TaxID=61149 RepID=A0A2P2K744_RHIMU